MENSLFQQAKNKVMNMMNMQTPASDDDKQLANHAIRAAYANATEEEKQELEQLEQQLRAKNHL